MPSGVGFCISYSLSLIPYSLFAFSPCHDGRQDLEVLLGEKGDTEGERDTRADEGGILFRGCGGRLWGRVDLFWGDREVEVTVEWNGGMV